MKCIKCNEREMKYIKRGLCGICYGRLYYNGTLGEYPNDHARWATSKYSPELLSAFNELLENNGKTLSEIGIKFGFSRENSRQLFEKIYGFHYSVIINKRKNIKKEQKNIRMQLNKDPRHKVGSYKEGGFLKMGAMTEKMVLDICEKLGYEVKPYLDSRVFDLVINNYKVEIKSTGQAALTSAADYKPKYRFPLSNDQKKADFIICHAIPVNKFFIIPNNQIPKIGLCGSTIYIPEKDRSNRYWRYLEAWDLLKRPVKSEIIFSATQPIFLDTIQ